jgi:hypothetical protein
MPYEHLAIVLPKTMQFTSDTAGAFSPMDDNGSPVQVATNVTPGEHLGFRVSGTGVPQDETASAQNQPEAGANGRMGPGGGLGTPIGSPDPLHQYRWPILGGLGIVLLAGGVYVAKRPKPAMAAAATSRDSVVVPDRSATLLEALKEELFQLELERQQERISPQEYATAKDALDQTIKRALNRRA